MLASSGRPLAVGLGAVVALLLAGGCGDDDTEPAADGGRSADTDPAPPPTGDLDGRSFVATDVEGHDVVEGTTVTIELTDGRLSAAAGCNTFGTTYRVEDGVLVTDELVMTEIGCEPALVEQDEWLGALLASGPSVTVDGPRVVLDGGPAGIVTLLDREVAEPDRPITDTLWIVDGLVVGDAVSSIPAGVTASLTIVDGTAMIETGCNTGSGEVTVDDGSLTFGPIATTLRACEQPAADVESVVLQTLVETVDADVAGDRLSLRRATAEGTVGLELVAAG